MSSASQITRSNTSEKEKEIKIRMKIKVRNKRKNVLSLLQAVDVFLGGGNIIRIGKNM